jgi:hypothetical protein
VRRISCSAWLLFLFAFTAPMAYGQTATIMGTVTDATGAKMPGVDISVVNELTGERHVEKTTSAGDFLVLALPVGSYHVEASKEGFSQVVRSGIRLDVNQNLRVDFQLKVGQVSERVEVTGGAPLVDTREVQVGSLVDSKRVQDLPLNGRNVYSLVTLLPGVSATSLPNDPDTSEGEQVNVNGSRITQTTFLMDGALNNGSWRNGGLISPNPDTVEEFRLITSNYNAEYGRSSGGVINVVTKSGTNQFHGTLFEYLRNSDTDSRSFFTPSVSILKQNQFGGAVGGPIKHDKLFFFFSYQGFRNVAGQFQNTARTPTAVERAGDFSALPVSQQPKDPNTGVLFPGGIIPASRLDPVAEAALAYIALPNTPDGRVQASENAADHDNQYFGKVDYLLNAAHRLSFTTFFVRSNNLFPFTNSSQGSSLPNYDPETLLVNQNNVIMNETWTISPSLLNQFTFNYINVPTVRRALNDFGWSTWGSQFVVGSLPQVPPRFIVTGDWTAGSQGDVNEVDQHLQFADSMSWIRGPHSFKFGGGFNRLVYDYIGTSRSSCNTTVNNSFTGNAFSDFLLGRAASMDCSNGFYPHLHSRQWSAFFQDDWKISRRITLNLGVRWEIFEPWSDANGGLQQYNPGQQSTRFPTAPLGLVFPGDKGVPAGLLPVDWHDFAPRLGLAIDPFGDGKTAIRAGYGIFYSFGFAGLWNSNVAQPFQIDVTAFGTPSFVNPYGASGGNPFPAAKGTFVLPLTVSWMNQSNRVPYVEQYSFTIDRQLGRSLNLTVGYLGNASRHLQYQRDANQAVYIPGQSTASNVNNRRPIEPLTFAAISEALTGANANYNSLQTTLNKQFSHGFTLLANYTYSKAIDLQSNDQQSVGELDFVNSNNTGLDRGISSLDLRHIFNLSFVYQTPQISSLGFVGRNILGGWQVNAIARYTSGHPFNVTSGVDSNLNGTNNDRPNLIGDPYINGSRSKSQRLAKFFDPAAFVAAPTGTYGNLGRNDFYGPGYANWDMSFFRNFPIVEHHTLQFRAELFNIFNHANFSVPTAVLTSGSVGQILTAGPGRIIQFGLKYSF